VDFLRRAVAAPRTEIVVHRAARRQIPRDVAPLAAGAQDMHHASTTRRLPYRPAMPDTPNLRPAARDELTRSLSRSRFGSTSEHYAGVDRGLGRTATAATVEMAQRQFETLNATDDDAGRRADTR